MKTTKLISLAMLALLSACATTNDSSPDVKDGESAQAEPAAAVELDSAIPEVSSSEVMKLQRDALALPMPSVADAEGYAVSYDAISGGHQSAREVDLCELAYLYDGGAGRYRVRDIVSVAETIEVDGRKYPAAFTYIQLELEQDWSGFAPRHPVLRIRGGALNKELTQSWDISLKRDEVLGLFLSSPLRGQNKGYYRTDTLGVFRAQAHGGFSNGHIFETKAVAIDELGKVSRELYQGLPRVIHRPPWHRLETPRDRCVHDIKPDAHQHDFDLKALREQTPKLEDIKLDNSPSN